MSPERAPLVQYKIPGPAGPLEVLFRPAAERGPHRGAAVICHPHPLYGGSMHTRLVFHLAAALHEAGFATLRLNFRGVGLSAGHYTGGPGEREDVRSALDHLQERLSGADLLVAGHSFGAWVGLRVGGEDPRVGRLVGVGMPLNVYEFAFLDGVSKDMLFVQGDRDRFGSAGSVRALAERVGGRAVILPGGEHLLEGHLPQLRDAVREHLAVPETGVPPRA